MFNLFKKKSELELLQIKHQKLLTEAYKLSHVNRSESDLKIAEAEVINKKIATIMKVNR